MQFARTAIHSAGWTKLPSAHVMPWCFGHCFLQCHFYYQQNGFSSFRVNKLESILDGTDDHIPFVFLRKRLFYFLSVIPYSTPLVIVIILLLFRNIRLSVWWTKRKSGEEQRSIWCILPTHSTYKRFSENFSPNLFGVQMVWRSHQALHLLGEFVWMNTSESVCNNILHHLWRT